MNPDTAPPGGPSPDPVPPPAPAPAPAPLPAAPARRRPERARVAAVLLSAAALVLTVLLFTPARVYLGNYMEFQGLVGENLRVFLVACAALFAALSVAMLLLSIGRRAGTIAVAVVTALAFLAWLQATFLVWDYGVLDGRDIDWAALRRNGVVDVAVWGAAAGIAVVFARRVHRASPWICAALVVAQAVAVAQLWTRTPKDQSFRVQESATDTLHRYSDHVNVVVMVIDTFQSDFFPDILAKHPGLAGAFDGFTYFRNALAGSDGTIVSVPIMLTGSHYDNSVPYLDYVKSSFRGNSLPGTLREYGFAVDLFPLLSYTVCMEYADLPFGTRKLRDPRAIAREQALLADLALFRCAPQPLKRLVYDRQHWFLSALLERRYEREDAREAPAAAAGGASGAGGDRSAGGAAGSAVPPGLRYARELENMQVMVNKNRDPKFLMTMLDQSSVMRGQDAFKFIHLKGLHLPLIMDENLAYGEMEPWRDNMLRQGAGMLKIVATYLERLARLGVYDETLVFVVGDHGSGVADAKVGITPYADRFNRGGPYPANFGSFKSAGIPLVLVKPIGARGPLATSEAPVGLADIPRTVVDELGIEADFPGKSMFSVAEGESRERIYRAFVGPQIDVVYLAPLLEYAVNGHSWDDTSWRETGKVYYPPR